MCCDIFFNLGQLRTTSGQVNFLGYLSDGQVVFKSCSEHWDGIFILNQGPIASTRENMVSRSIHCGIGFLLFLFHLLYPVIERMIELKQQFKHYLEYVRYFVLASVG